MTTLTDGQIITAEQLWRAGRSLGEIADVIGCSIYVLSPWIYSEDFCVAVDAAHARAAASNQTRSDSSDDRKERS